MSWSSADGDPRITVKFDKWIEFFKETLEYLNAESRDYIVFGGVAFSFLMRPVRTKDLDLAVIDFPTPEEEFDFSTQLQNKYLKIGATEVKKVDVATRKGRRISFSIAFDSGAGLAVELWQYINEREPKLYPTTLIKLDNFNVKILTKESWIATKIGQPKNIDPRDVHRLALICDEADIDETYRILKRAELLDYAHNNLKSLSLLGFKTPQRLDKLRRLISAPGRSMI
ncbi:MAG: hypothetical protein ACE5GD_03050 [Candidatus Geothermarchaeales archaeon]